MYFVHEENARTLVAKVLEMITVYLKSYNYFLKINFIKIDFMMFVTTIDSC
jgi:hypothetical protein